MSGILIESRNRLSSVNSLLLSFLLRIDYNDFSHVKMKLKLTEDYF